MTTKLLPQKSATLSSRCIEIGQADLAAGRVVAKWFRISASSRNPLKLAIALPVFGAVALLMTIVMLAFTLVLAAIILTLIFAWMLSKPLKRRTSNEF